MKKNNKKLKIKWYNLSLLISLLVIILIFLFSTFNIYDWLIDSKNIKNKQTEVLKDAIITEKSDNENTEIINNQKDLSKNNEYWSYIKQNLLDVDFTKLKKKNSDVKGWIKVNGTNVNYPYVQTVDNDFYLNHSIDKSSNKAGWIFMDYRNDNNFNDKNTILYAHNRKDKTMFGSLKNVLTKNWLKNKNNFTINISTEKENSLWQIFSVYHIETTNDYIQVYFTNDDEFLKFSNKLIDRSVHNFNSSISKDDKILTLSTCYKENEKLVVHAKLIKKEIKQ